MAKIPETNYESQVINDLRDEAYASLKRLQAEQKANSVEGENKEAADEEVIDNKIYIYQDGVRVDMYGVYFDNTLFCNRPIQIKHLIRDSKTNVWWILQVGNDAELEMDTPIYINISNKDFSSFARFRQILRSHQVTALGKEERFFKILAAMPKVDESTYVETLGWNSKAKAFFFSNAAVKDGKAYFPNDFGLVSFDQKDEKDKETSETYFMPYVDSLAGSQLKDDTAISFTFEENKDINFNKWFIMMYEAHKEYCILPTCFMIASLFRDLIFDETHFMPILYLKGVRGSGKSSIIRNLTSVFGKAQKEISLKSNQNTPKSMSRLMAQKSNALVWFDEYHNGVNPNIQGMLQSFYDGAGYQKAALSNDNRVDGVEIKSSLCLTSNYLPEDEIFFSRTMLVQANETKKTTEQRAAFKKLSELERGNLSQIVCELIQYRDLIEKEFKATYNGLYSYFFDHCPGIDTRFFDNVACVLAPVMILLTHKKIRMVQLDFEELLADMARQNIKDQFAIIKENTVAVEFWNIINILYDKGLVKKTSDFKLLPGKVGDQVLYDEIIALRFSRLYQHYASVAGNKAKSRQEIQQMLETSEYFIEKKNVQFYNEEKGSSVPTSALILNYQKMKKLIGVSFE